MQRRISRTVLGVVAVALSCIASAAASSTTSRYQLAGAETRASSTIGTFVGGAIGAGTDALAWKAVVNHTPLSHSAGGEAVVTGGTVSLRLWSGDSYRTLQGSLASGSIMYLPNRSSLSACGRQVFSVEATIALPAQAEAGELHITLTHHRRSILGRCLIYAATVRGTLDLAV